jgi:hypothetical protein
MDVVVEFSPPPLPNVTALPPALPSPADPHAAERRRECLLDALKAALADGAEHRLFRSGRLAGLFPSKHGDAGEAARQALAAGLLEHERTEVKGKFVFEWVKATPKALSYVSEHDSPKAILRELKEVLGETKRGVPAWMESASAELRTLSGLFERRSAALLSRLESLAERVEATLHRAEAAGIARAVNSTATPWAEGVLAHLDRRAEAGVGPCPLPELFRTLHEGRPGLMYDEFQSGLRHLADAGAVKLLAGEGEPEYAIPYEGRLNHFVGR